MAERIEVLLSGSSKIIKTIEIPQTSRHGRWIIETPNIGDFELLTQDAPRVIEDALEECHPELKKYNVRVILSPQTLIVDGVPAGEYFRFDTRKKTGEITVSLASIFAAQINSPEVNWHMQALRFILHGLFEADYLFKSRSSGKEVDRKKLGDPNYSEADHEVIANRRALRQLKVAFGLDFNLDEEGILILS